MQKLKIKNRLSAISPGLFDKKENLIEILQDTSLLSKAGSNFYRFLPDESSLLQNIAPDTYFFYTIEQYKDKKEDGKKVLRTYERGIAQILKKRQKYFLDRLYLFEGKNDDHETTPLGFISYEENEYIIIGSYKPENHYEVYAMPHGVAHTSDEPFAPEVTQIEEFSVLGRLDGEIESINQEELKKILNYVPAVDEIQQTTSPLLLSTNYIELQGKNSLISSDRLVCKPRKTRPRTLDVGSIIFNSKQNRFEGYDGQKWRPLQWGDE